MNPTNMFTVVENGVILPTGMNFHDRIQFLAWHYGMTLTDFIGKKCEYRNPDKLDQDPAIAVKSISTRLADYTSTKRFTKDVLLHTPKGQALVQGAYKNCSEVVTMDWLLGEDNNLPDHPAYSVCPDIPDLRSRMQWVKNHMVPDEVVLRRMELPTKGKLRDVVASYIKGENRYFPFVYALAANVPPEWVAGKIRQCILPIGYTFSGIPMYQDSLEADAIEHDITPLNLTPSQKLYYMAYRHGMSVQDWLQSYNIPSVDIRAIRGYAYHNSWHPVMEKYVDRIASQENCYIPRNYFSDSPTFIGKDYYAALPPKIRDAYVHPSHYVVFPRIPNRKYRVLYLIHCLGLDTYSDMVKRLDYSERYVDNLLAQGKITNSLLRMISIVYGVPMKWLEGELHAICVPRITVRFHGEGYNEIIHTQPNRKGERM